MKETFFQTLLLTSPFCHTVLRHEFLHPGCELQDVVEQAWMKIERRRGSGFRGPPVQANMLIEAITGLIFRNRVASSSLDGMKRDQVERHCNSRV